MHQLENPSTNVGQQAGLEKCQSKWGQLEPTKAVHVDMLRSDKTCDAGASKSAQQLTGSDKRTFLQTLL
jgi:hypothetical protein